MKVDFGDYPVVIELYYKESYEYIYAVFRGAERKKLEGSSIEKVVYLALANLDNERANYKEIQHDIKNLMGDPEHAFDIYGHKINVELDSERNVLVDHREDLFNNSDYLKKLKTGRDELYLGTEIRVHDADCCRYR